MSITSTIKTTEHAARGRAVDDAVHNGEMEGFTVSAAFDADAGEYTRGAIDLDEFGRRVRARNSVA